MIKYKITKQKIFEEIFTYIEKNGVNIPLNELSIKNKLLKKSKNIVIFCQSGKRSKIALNLLKENEFLNLKLMTENAIEISRIINK